MRYGVVRAVAANRASKVKLTVEAVLLDEAMGGHGHAAALRIAHRGRLPVIAERTAEGGDDGAVLVKCDAVARGVHHLPCRQLLIKIRVGQVFGEAVALIVGQDDQVIIKLVAQWLVIDGAT